ncbi:protein-S-isoprenylcysteine O-methyltransferase isoform X1 [Neodiprion virginianus]|uniref:protein-S-isoprenylcysteine O-methyltransferase isoform X1 n=1 Tax=Neodiprion virginianus TaxID=2961670 RepID=UPI001EE6C0C8|nr:protein-S-isoprenylcysteine O-methyltransferase isoform X1 [Neodiprion virginianus]
MLCYEGKISVFTFLTGVIFALLPKFLFRLQFETYSLYFQNVWLTYVVLYILLNFLIIIAFRGFIYQVAVRATSLGYAFGIGILIYLTAPSSWQMFGIYTSVMATFHYSEFLAITWTNPSALSLDSFMLNHSIEYGIAAFVCWMEFIIERYFFPEMKEPHFVSWIGLTFCVCGEILRKLAMFTARKNFNHIIQSTKADGHQLVTHGVYSFSRHPSYVGWFYWSIGTQLILQNPFCAVCYTLISWRFFQQRVLLEEMTLINFFGQDYVDYQKQVGTGLPLISGYKFDL